MKESSVSGQYNNRELKGYLANGLFSQADIMFNEYLAKMLRENLGNLDLYVPQENMAINDKNSYADSQMIADGDDKYIWNADFMVSVIDGVEIDSGVACEIGVFSALSEFEYIYNDRKLPIFALYTDSRQQGTDNDKKIEALKKDPTENQFVYRNLYVQGKIKNSGGGIYSSVTDLVMAIKQYFELPLG